jgi:RNA polymerase sigma-70 factor, ECF subfamily
MGGRSIVIPNPAVQTDLTPHSVTDASDHSLLKLYREGNQEAALELYQRYSHRLRALARAQLSAGLAGHVDVDDIVQSVFGSFFRGVNGSLYDVPLGEELWKLLLVIALHKIRNQGSYHQAQKRDIGRTVPVDQIDTAAKSADDSAARAFLQMVVEEALSQLSPNHRQMVELRMEGFSVEEIAAKTNRAKRTVERLLQQARAKLGDLLADES